MHKEPKPGSKEYFTHEGKESDEMEMKERKEDPKHEKKEQEEGGKASHLEHPQLHGPKAHMLMNDLAYHLHHPQFGLKGPKLPASKPKG